MSNLSTANQKTVTTAGQAVVLGTESGYSVLIKALSTNTGLIYVKPGGTIGNNYSGSGFVLSAKESIVLPISGIASDIVIDSSVNGEGVSYVASKVSPTYPSR